MADQALTASADIAPAEDKPSRSYLTAVAVVAIGIVEIGWLGMIGWGGLWLMGF